MFASAVDLVALLISSCQAGVLYSMVLSIFENLLIYRIVCKSFVELVIPGGVATEYSDNAMDVVSTDRTLI